MKLLKLNCLFVILFSASLLTSCNNEPVDPVLARQVANNSSVPSNVGGSTGGGSTTLPPLNGNASLAIDGVTLTANEITAFKKRQSSAPGVSDFISYSISINNIDNSVPSNSKSTILQFGNTTGNTTYNLPFDTYGGGTGITYISDLTNPLNTNYVSLDMSNTTNPTGTVNITSNNLVSRTFSGNFNGTVYLYDYTSGTGTLLGTKSISNGVFTNVHYKFLNDPSHFVVNMNSVGYANTSTLVETSFENNTIVIDAPDDSSNNDIILVIDNSTPVGTYTIGSSSSATTVKGEYISNGTSLPAQSGSITITTKTANRIAGTYNFTTAGNSFTQGVFDLEY